MSDALARARAIAAAANEQRAGMDDAHRDYYVPVGMFVGEHTGFVVMPDVMVTAMLDALEAGQALADLDTWSWEDRQSAVGEWDQRIARVRDRQRGGRP